LANRKKYTNKEIGDIFGLTYSSISRRKSIVLKHLKSEGGNTVKELFVGLGK